MHCWNCLIYGGNHPDCTCPEPEKEPVYEVYEGEECMFESTSESKCIEYIESEVDFLTKEDYITLMDGFEVKGFMIAEKED